MARLGTVERIIAASAITMVCAALAAPAPVAAQTAGLNLVLSTNQSIYGEGTTLEATLGVDHTAAPVTVDLIFGVLLPDGDTVVSFQGMGRAPVFGRLSQPASIRSLLPAATLHNGALTVIPEFFRYTWQGSEPFGLYQMFFAATRPGALNDGRIDGGDVLALKIAPFSLQPPASVATDAARATTALVPITGGTVVAAAADGTTFTLVIPAGALPVPTAITLTPVTTMTGVPGAMQGITAVRAEPEGLQFGVPATLTIHAATPGAQPGLVGFTTGGGGAGLGLTPAVALPNGDIVLASVTHFSVIGSGVPANLGDLLQGSGPSVFYGRAVALGNDLAARQALLDEWYAAIRPTLQAGLSDTSALVYAIGEFYEWEVARVVVFDSNLLNVADSLRAKGQIADGLRSAIGRLNQQCTVTRDVAVAEALLRLRSMGRQVFDVLTFPYLPSPLPLFSDLQGLDLASVVADLCVRARITSATFPGAPPPGVAAPLTVVAGLAFGATPPVFTPPLQVIVDALGATPAQRVGLTNTAGTFATAFTPVAGGVTLDVLATLVDPALPFLSLAALSDTRQITSAGAVVVTPSETTIVPGATRQFSATVAGTANQAVTWTVNGGGTISNAGLFTSNGTLGTFFVTATSVAIPSSVGVAQITVANALTGSLAISTSTASPSLVTINAVRGGVTTSFSGPIVETAARVAQAQQHLAAVTSLDFVSVVLGVPATLSFSLPGATVTGDVNLISSRAAVCAPAEVVASTIAVTIGEVAGGRTLVRACGASITLAALGSLGDSNALVVDSSFGGNVAVSTTFARTVQVGACTSGAAQLNVTRLRSLHILDTVNCTMTLNGTVGLGVPFGGISVQRNVNSSLGVIRASDLNVIGIEANTGTSVAIEAGNLVTFGNPDAPFIMQNNAGIPLSAIQMGNIAGNVTLRFNTGFTDQQAQAYVNARTVGGAVTISNNQP